MQTVLTRARGLLARAARALDLSAAVLLALVLGYLALAPAAILAAWYWPMSSEARLLMVLVGACASAWIAGGLLVEALAGLGGWARRRWRARRVVRP